jgi:hypothetical protein
MVGKMEASIGNAIDGNLKMQQTLASLNIGINDINTLSPDQIFNKMAESLANINDPMTRAAKATEIFGKAGKFFNWADYVQNIKAVYGTMDKFGASQEKAAAISERMNMVVGLIRAEFLRMLQPIMNLIAPTDNLSGAFNRARLVAGGLVVSLGAFIALQVYNAVLTIVGALKSFVSWMGLSAGTTAESTRQTLLNANATIYLEGAIGRLGRADAALIIAEERLVALQAAGTASAEALAAAENAVTLAKTRQAEATLALGGVSTKAGIAVKDLGLAGSATTGIFGGLGAAIRGLFAPLAALGALILGATAPAWATIAAAIVAVSFVLAAGRVIWAAFGDDIKEIARIIYDSLITAFQAVDDFLITIANKIREFRGLPPIELRVQTKGGNIGATQTPANAPSLLTQSVGAQSKGLSYGLSPEAKSAQDSLKETILGLAAEAQYQRDIVGLGETDAKIKKTITDEANKLLKTHQTLTQEQKNQIAGSIQTAAAATAHKDIKDKIYSLDVETNLLHIKDTNERDIQTQKLALIHQFGSAITADDMKRYETALRINQATQEQLKIEEALAAMRGEAKVTAENAIAGAGIAQTPAEKIQAQYDLQLNQLNQALDRQLISEQAYTAAVQKIQREQYSSELQLYIDTFDAKEALRQQEIDAEARKYAALLMLQKDYNGEQKVSNAEALERGKKRAEFEHMTEAQKTAWAIEQLSTISSAVGTHNKTLFRISQAASIGKAIMSTYEGATKAYADYGYPWGIAAAAAVIASGMAQVAQIRSQTFSGKALGGPMVGGQSYLVGEKGPEIFTPGGSGNMTANDKLGGSTNVTFNIVANDTRGFDELLSQRKGLITKIIADAQLEKGRRQ